MPGRLEAWFLALARVCVQPVFVEGGAVIDREHRVNEQIRISPLRVIDQNGKQLGVLPRDEALALARRAGLDLVEVNPNSRPPVCRLMDYGKFKYQQKKKHKREHQVQLKEIRMRSNISDHDLDTKLRHARELLEDRDKVQFTMILMSRGRQLLNVDDARAKMQSIIERLADVGRVERPLRLEGNRLTVMLGPIGEAKRSSAAK